MDYSIRAAQWPQDRDALALVRTRVFVQEQSVPPELEWDDQDEQALHWLALNNQGEPIGTIRLLRDGHIGRMAVLADCRGQGIGSALLNAALQRARDEQIYEAYLYAQVHAVAFYQKHGFIAQGEKFLDANIPHLTMRQPLTTQRLLGVHGGNFAPASLAAVAHEIISQTSKQLRILSFNLAPAVFDNPEMESLISALARKSRYSDIRLLVVDTSTIVARGHRLLRLQHRLSSAIKIRRVSGEPHTIKDNLILADLCGVVCQSVNEPEHLWANFNNRPVALTYISQFDDLWERGVADHDLRRLEI